MTYLHHLTLVTGHVTRQRREDVEDAAVGRVQEMLDSALTGGRPEVLPGHVLTAANEGAKNIIATVSACGIGDGTRDMPFVTMGVALRSRSAHRLWRALVGLVDSDPAISPPQAPWLAVHLWPTVALDPSALQWLVDFERCLGWAWMEYDR